MDCKRDYEERMGRSAANFMNNVINLVLPSASESSYNYNSNHHTSVSDVTFYMPPSPPTPTYQYRHLYTFEDDSNGDKWYCKNKRHLVLQTSKSSSVELDEFAEIQNQWNQMLNNKCRQCEDEIRNEWGSLNNTVMYGACPINVNGALKLISLIDNEKNKWMEIDHRIEKYSDYYNHALYVWRYCKIYCKARNHVVFDCNEYNWPISKHQAVSDVTRLEECPECRKLKEKIKAKCDYFEAKQQNILSVLKTEPQSIKLSDITKLEAELNPLFDECAKAIESVNILVKDSQSILKEEKENMTYEAQKDLDQFVQKAVLIQDLIAKNKKKVFLMDKQLNETEISFIKNENEINEQLIVERQDKIALNEQNATIDKLQSEVRELIRNKSIQDLKTGEMGRMFQIDQLIQRLLKLLQYRYEDNEQRMNKLNECKERINKIRVKLEHQKTKNKHLLKLLDEEYDRLSTATQSAMKKFEQNGVYFLSVTVGLKEEIIDKFVEFGCDKLDDIKNMNDEDLVEIGIESKLLRKTILKHIYFNIK